ncbi:hypothetical protein [Streptomyces cupreus]|uniref:Thioesterase n=1 Tax=Streptomyces cupreus TaxID=2759956 RepID=A0A7X1MA23_9ACTN|nr:hypothetical protein [Streptomyces cupreus]MBC2903697.1 hypothetical protein [Streptomyces cupreus]
MASPTDTAGLPPLLRNRTRHVLRPRYEGANICTWIGFKHVNYLVEEAVLAHFREAGVPAGRLYEDFGLCLGVTALATRIGTALHLDDKTVADVTPAQWDASGLRMRVTLALDRDGTARRAATSTVRAVLRTDTRGGPVATVPEELAGWSVPGVAAPLSDVSRPVPVPEDIPGEEVVRRLTADVNAFAVAWRIPYYYCHFTEQMQISGYLRALEGAVDLFLADRGVSIRSLLDERNLIPVVPRSSVTMLGEALMEDRAYTVLTVEEVFKNLTFTLRMDCYVHRGGALLPTATGRITHGYATIRGRRDWSLVGFDPHLLRALGPAGG